MHSKYMFDCIVFYRGTYLDPIIYLKSDAKRGFLEILQTTTMTDAETPSDTFDEQTCNQFKTNSLSIKMCSAELCTDTA